jgi:hypothetical protein
MLRALDEFVIEGRRRCSASTGRSSRIRASSRARPATASSSPELLAERALSCRMRQQLLAMRRTAPSPRARDVEVDGRAFASPCSTRAAVGGARAPRRERGDQAGGGGREALVRARCRERCSPCRSPRATTCRAGSSCASSRR